MEKWNNKGKNKIVSRVLDVAGFLLIILFLIVTAITWMKSPDIIPTHYNALGIADGYGSKNMNLILVPITLAIYGGLFFLGKHPEFHNYPKKVTDENRDKLYNMSTTLVKVLNIEVTAIFLYQAATTGKESIGTMFLPLTMVIIFATLGVFIYKLMKVN